MILPIFAFANSGIQLNGITFNELMSPLPLGVAAGLLLGKPLGIFLFSFISVKLGFGKLPEPINLKQVFAVSALCEIGFTMSICILQALLLMN